MTTKDQDIKKKRRNTFIFGAVGLALILGISLILNYTRQKASPPPPPPKIEITKKEEELARDAWIQRSSQALLEQQKRIEELEKAVKGSREKEQILNVPMPQPPTPPPGEFPQVTPETTQRKVQPGDTTVSKTVPESTPEFPPPPELPVAQDIRRDEASVSRSAQQSAQQKEEQKVLTNLIVLDVKEKVDTSQEKKEDRSKKDKEKEKDKEDAKTKKISLSEYLPDGSYVKAVLLNGVEAPTGQHGVQDPYPVLLRVVDLASLPNRFRSDFVDCRMIGEARGSLSSNRVLIRVVTLSCIRNDGSVIVEPVTGYVNGEDGKVGVSGVVVTKQGAILARMLLADFINGIGSALRQTSTTITVGTSGTVQTVNPEDAFTAALGSGLAQTASRLAQFYYDMAKEMFPVVEVNAGRTVEVVFISSTAKGK